MADYKAQKANPSANAQMMDQYTKIYNYWSFIEKTLRQQTLAQKYQALLAGCFLSNPVEAKMAFKEENEESQIQLAAFPYSDIQDDKVKISESDLKAKYDEIKARFKQPVESRDIKLLISRFRLQMQTVLLLTRNLQVITHSWLLLQILQRLYVSQLLL